jgi:hypothetical protein
MWTVKDCFDIYHYTMYLHSTAVHIHELNISQLIHTSTVYGFPIIRGAIDLYGCSGINYLLLLLNTSTNFIILIGFFS